MKLTLDKRFKKRVRGMVQRHSFEVGVLEDKPHRQAQWRTKENPNPTASYAGGSVRKTTRKSYQTISEVSEHLRQFLGFNYLTKPFQKKSSQILKFTNEFFKLTFGRSQKKRVENLLQAIVRNPMLRGDYGSNSKKAQKIKGFDRLTIDTGQLFKAIKARVITRSKV